MERVLHERQNEIERFPKLREKKGKQSKSLTDFSNW